VYWVLGTTYKRYRFHWLLGTEYYVHARANNFKKIQILNSVTRLGTEYYVHTRSNDLKKNLNF
jgi:hypothetical protein